MKALLNTLYVNREDVYLSLDGGNIVVLKNNQELARFPLHNFEQITTFGYVGASPALMQKCAEMNIALNFMSPRGRFRARVVGKTSGNVLLRKEQYRRSDDAQASLNIAQKFLLGKIYNARWFVNRTLRDHALRLDKEKFRKVETELRDACQKVMHAEDLQSLRGIEGKAAAMYFSIFDEMILQQKKDFFFTERNRRPPLDNMNCLLSFIYALLLNETTSALEGVGLDPYVGFLHCERPGRPSLGLDLMEELRAVMADRLALSMVNLKQIRGEDFYMEETGAVRLTDEGRKKVFTAWHNCKENFLTHPYLEEKIQWGLVAHAQALLLARYLRGDLDDYPPLLWK